MKQNNKFLNFVINPPKNGDEDGIYIVKPKDNSYRAIWIVLWGVPLKLIDTKDTYYKEDIDSFIEKLEKSDVYQQLLIQNIDGLIKSLEEKKVNKEDLNALSFGLIPKGSVASLSELNSIANPKNNWGYIVENQKDENGNSYIYRYEEENKKWINTKLTSFSSAIIFKDSLGDDTKSAINQKVTSEYFKSLIKTTLPFDIIDKPVFIDKEITKTGEIISGEYYLSDYIPVPENTQYLLLSLAINNENILDGLNIYPHYSNIVGLYDKDKKPLGYILGNGFTKKNARYVLDSNVKYLIFYFGEENIYYPLQYKFLKYNEKTTILTLKDLDTNFELELPIIDVASEDKLIEIPIGVRPSNINIKNTTTGEIEFIEPTSKGKVTSFTSIIPVMGGEFIYFKSKDGRTYSNLLYQYDKDFKFIKKEGSIISSGADTYVELNQNTKYIIGYNSFANTPYSMRLFVKPLNIHFSKGNYYIPQTIQNSYNDNLDLQGLIDLSEIINSKTYKVGHLTSKGLEEEEVDIYIKLVVDNHKKLELFNENREEKIKCLFYSNNDELIDTYISNYFYTLHSLDIPTNAQYALIKIGDVIVDEKQENKDFIFQEKLLLYRNEGYVYIRNKDFLYKIPSFTSDVELLDEDIDYKQYIIEDITKTDKIEKSQFDKTSTIIDNTQFDLTDYLKVIPSSTIILTGEKKDNIYCFSELIGLYDKDKKPLGYRLGESRIHNSSENKVLEYEIPYNAEYIITYRNNLSGIQFYPIIYYKNSKTSLIESIKDIKVNNEVVPIKQLHKRLNTAEEKIDELYNTPSGPSDNHYKPRPSNGVVNFKVSVNTKISDYTSNTLLNQDLSPEDIKTYIKDDWGLLLLPTNYSPNLAPIRLVISCHGTGTWIDSDSKTTSGSPDYLLAQGYAVLDMNGVPGGIGQVTGDRHFGSPLALRSYLAGYKYVTDNYNLRKDGCFVFGISMGGLSSMMLCSTGTIPVLAQGGFCPCIDTYRQSYGTPWSGAIQRKSISEQFDFKGEKPTFTSSIPVPKEEEDFFYNNIDKVVGYNSMWMNTIGLNLDKAIKTPIPTSVIEETEEEKSIFSNVTKIHPCPIKIWHNTNDTTVPFKYSKYFIEMCRRGGTLAYLRTFPSGGHNAWANGETVKNVPTKNSGFISINTSYYELVEWFKRFE